MTRGSVVGFLRWRVVRVALFLLGPSAAWSPAAAQGSGAVAGRIEDRASRAPVAAEVSVDGARRVHADARGEWRVDGLAPGQHALRIRSPGYVPRDLTVTVEPGREVRADASLEVAIVPLSAVVVTAARREQRLADAIVETELIPAEELRRSGASDVASAIVDRVGVQTDGGVPSGAGVQIRGFDSRRVLVLLDGQPLTGRLNGNFDLSRLPLSAVERIEVVKGPQSTLYGSEAMGGVINVITRRAPDAEGVGGAFSTTVGSVGRREASGEGTWRRGAWSAAAQGGRRTVDLAPGVPGDAGTFARRWDGLASLRWEPDSAHRYEIGGLLVDERQRYRTGQLFHFGDNTQLAAHGSANTPLAGGRLTSTLSLSRYEHLSRASTGGAPVSDSGARDLQQLVQASLLYSAAVPGGVVDLGADGKRETIEADRVDAPTNAINTAEPFVQYSTTFGPVSVSPGVRVSASDRWGSFVAPRLAALWRPVPSLALRAAAGRGFRAPDFKELYLDFVNSAAGYAVRGNPDLRPERSTSLSLGAEWDGASVYAHASAFRNTYHDFIEFGAPDATGTYTYANVDRGSTVGVEVEGGVFVRAWRVDASAGWLRTRDEATDLPLLGRPNWTARIATGGPLPFAVHADLSASWVGSTPIDRTIEGETLERSGFARVDVRAARPLAAGVELSAGATNLFDRELGVDWPGFTGRQVYVGLSWRVGVR